MRRVIELRHAGLIVLEATGASKYDPKGARLPSLRSGRGDWLKAYPTLVWCR
jgi:hypothetical protein